MSVEEWDMFISNFDMGGSTYSFGYHEFNSQSYNCEVEDEGQQYYETQSNIIQEQIKQHEQMQQAEINQMSFVNAQVNTQKIKNKQIDYQKNIPNYILKRCLKQMFGRTYQKIVHKLCKQQNTQMQELQKQYKHWLKYQTIGLGKVYDMLTKTKKGVQKVLNRFFIWYLRKKYIFELMKSNKIDFPQSYIRRKNELLYLAQNAKSSRFIERTNLQSIKMGDHY